MGKLVNSPLSPVTNRLKNFVKQTCHVNPVYNLYKLTAFTWKCRVEFAVFECFRWLISSVGRFEGIFRQKQ